MFFASKAKNIFIDYTFIICIYKKMAKKYKKFKKNLAILTIYVIINTININFINIKYI